MNMDYIEEFLSTKGLTEEYDEFVKRKLAERETKQKKMSVGEVPFEFRGTYSQGCLQGRSFDDGWSLNYILDNTFDLPFVDPAGDDDTTRALLKDEMEWPSRTYLMDALNEDDFNALLERLMKFINQDNKTFDYHRCDAFGFTEYRPSDDAIKDWLGHLLIERDDADCWRKATFEVTPN